jgi:uroporphyrinogen decarboxylase
MNFEPDIIRQHIFPQYKRVIDLVHGSGKKFLLHSCGNIFPLMDDIINLGIVENTQTKTRLRLFQFGSKNIRIESGFLEVLI